MKALVYERSVPRYVVANLASRLGRSSSALGSVRLREMQPPALPDAEWMRLTPLLSGICGSDVETVAGRNSGTGEQLTSFPFVLGHEIVARVDDTGERVVVQPALGCLTRGVPLCPSCATDHPGPCHNLTTGALAKGMQTGFCASTGGGWSNSFVAHVSQLHRIPDGLTNEAAVMVEPTACAVHAAVERGNVDGKHVAVIGAGTLGLLTVAALRGLTTPRVITVAAKHPHQRRLAAEFGADVVAPADLTRALRLATGSMMLEAALLAKPRLSGGVDVVFDCVGSSASITQALAVVAPRGRIVLVGMPASVSLDLAPLWQREIELVGAYCYTPADFTTAIGLAQTADLGRLVSARYPLGRHHDAIAHASEAGRRGAVKVVFDLQPDAATRPAVARRITSTPTTATKDSA